MLNSENTSRAVRRHRQRMGMRQPVAIVWTSETPAPIAEAPVVSDLGTCEWFALCDHQAVQTETHPILGEVPICQRCIDKVGRIDGPTIGVMIETVADKAARLFAGGRRRR